jgi:hypothetical protein
MVRKYLLALLLIIGFIACSTNYELNGIWSDGFGTEYRFDNGYWEIWAINDNEPMSKGYYTINSNLIIKTTTHVYIDGKWLDKNSIILREYFIAEHGLNETQMDKVFEIMFWLRTLTFSEEGNSLIITANHEADGVTVTTTIKRK